MRLSTILFFYTIFIAMTTLLQHKTPYPLGMLLFAAAFVTLQLWSRPVKYMEVYRFAMLAGFHYFSQNDWCMPLYLFVSIPTIFKLKDKRFLTVFLLLVAVAYEIVRFLYKPYAPTDAVRIVFDLFIFVTVVYLVQLTDSQRTKRFYKLDELTGLPSFEEFRERLDDYIPGQRQFVLVFVHCIDLESATGDQGYESGGNQALKQIADLLKIVFSDAGLLSRTGGDEFALMLEMEKNTLTYIHHQLNLELPKLTGIQLTYGYAIYPDDGATKEELIMSAQSHLFNTKNEIWLKKQEQMFRSEKMRVVGELASGLAHEIRNPLTTIKGLLRISQENGYNIKPWYALMMDEITRMSDLTAEFLKFAKPHSTNFHTQPLSDCIQRVISLMESEAARLGHKIVFDEHFPGMCVLIDQDKMVQLLLNLVKNAFEAMQEHGQVRIQSYKMQNHAVIEVSDTGNGIPEAELDKIFHPFYTTKESGTGLGLSICHKIVQDHNGTLELESVLHEGTTFRITLPLVS